MNRNQYGQFVSPTNEHLDEIRKEHGDKDYVYVEAQDAHPGMCVLHPGARPSHAWKRVARVDPIYGGVCIYFDDGEQLQRNREQLLLVNASDLPTAFALSKYGIGYQSLNEDSLRLLREKLLGYG